MIFAALAVAGLLWTDFAGTPGHAQETGGFRIIVNISNPIREVSRKQLEKIFLKKQKEWPNGVAITVADQRPERQARQAFSRAILAKDPAAVEAYWSKLIFSGMGIPPIKLASDVEVMTFIGNNVGSIGYVSAGATLQRSVKELGVTP